MKKVFKLLVASVFTVAIAYGVASNDAPKGSTVSLNNVESLSSSELGCVNRYTNGHCVTDGPNFFCANV